jgi:hypothetical protein
VDVQRIAPFCTRAQLLLLGFAHDRAVDGVGPAAGDEVLDAQHHAFLVDDDAEADAAGEVGSGAAQRLERAMAAATPPFMSALPRP